MALINQSIGTKANKIEEINDDEPMEDLDEDQ
jgi:hypothetical protein